MGLTLGAFLTIHSLACAQSLQSARNFDARNDSRWYDYQQLSAQQSLFPERNPAYEHAPAVVSSDALRNPISLKAHNRLKKIVALAETGDVAKTIHELDQMLKQFPDAAAYVKSIRGAQYLMQGRWDAAANDLAVATSMLPHDGTTRSNYALALMMNGRFDQAEYEARRAVDLGGPTHAVEILQTLETRKANLKAKAQEKPLAAQQELASAH
jgi:tetratricopeptide (TPR) repeat protein